MNLKDPNLHLIDFLIQMELPTSMDLNSICPLHVIECDLQDFSLKILPWLSFIAIDGEAWPSEIGTVGLFPNTMKWTIPLEKRNIHIFYSRNGTDLEIYNRKNIKHSSETIAKRLFTAFNFHFVRLAYQIRFDMRASTCIRKKWFKRRALDPNLYGIQSKN